MHISVALCTYNGARYLLEQLDSIASQTRLPNELVVCDDRSTDDTVEIVRSFAEEASFPVRLHVNERPLGAMQNFGQAIGLCKGEYVALSDQDDIWLPDKLKITLDAMLKAEYEFGAKTPILVHTDLQVIDEERRPLAQSFYEHQGFRRSHANPLVELLVENYMTGCTVMVNRALREVALPVPLRALMHDWWLALVAAAAGRIVSLPETTVLYRQHGRNAVGARRWNLNKYIFGWKSLANRVWGRFTQSEALEERLQGRVNDEVQSFLHEYQNRVRAGGLLNVYWIGRRGVSMQGLARTMIVYFLLLKRGWLGDGG